MERDITTNFSKNVYFAHHEYRYQFILSYCTEHSVTEEQMIGILLFSHWQDFFFMNLEVVFLNRLSELISEPSVDLSDCVPLIYPQDTDSKESTNKASSVSILDIYIEVYSSNHLSNKAYGK